MFCKRFFAVLTALCLVFSMVPVHSHADHTHALTSTVHSHQERLATHSVRRGSNDSYYISPSREAVLPAGENEYVVSGVYQEVCQWGISQNGYLYIWCDTDMPAGNASGDYPWYAYKALFNQVYIDAKSVAAHAFSGYTDLYTAEFAVSLERIEEQAFSDCDQLGQLWFYGNAPIVGSNAFGGVSAVLLCHYGNTSWDSLWGSSFGGALEWQYWVNSLNGGMYDSIEWYVYEDMSLSLFGIGGPMRSQTSAEGYPWGPYLQELTYLEIEQISDLGNYAFAGARKVTDFSWDSCLTSIGDYAFSGTNASDLRVTGSVTHVGDWAFSDCAALTMVLFGENVRYLDSGAFADCAALDELVFEGDPPVIAEDAFRNVAATATYPDTGTWTQDHFLHYGGNLSWGPYTYDVDGGTFSGIRWAVTNTGVLRLEGSAGVMENLSDASLYPWAAYANDIQYVQCTGVTHLGSHCFKNFTALVTVSFDSQLASIGDGTFQGCDQFVMSFSGSIPSTGSEVFTSRDITLEYPESDPTWTEQAISEFFGYIPGENELPPIDFPSGIDCGITAQEVYDAIIALKVLYPEGMGWTNEDFYAWDGGIYPGGYGCAGFAFLLSDRAFGDEPARIIDEDITIDDVRVGDILRINNDTHSVIVLEVHEDHIVIAEGNYNRSIHWGRTLSAATVASVTDYIMTRYPLHSWNTHSCLEDRACSVCGLQETAPGHSWQDATCAAAKTCKVCGATEGTPTDQHVFSSAADNDCDVCGYRRDVGTELPDDVFDPFSAFELEVLRLTNLERLKEGLEPLTTTEIHQQAAHIRAEEVLSLFSHDRPNGTDCFTVLDELGIGYWSAAENIAKGQGNPAAVVNAWMNSTGHRNNILNPRLGHMGVGEKNRAWVQIFTDAGRYTSIRVDVSGTLSVKPGTDIDSMGLVALLNSEDGICWLPLAGAYCSGYDPNQAGEQTVTVSVLGVTCTFTVTVEAHKHAWTEATCDTPKTCSVCGKAEGAPLGHDWQAATCETPKTCVRCGETEGTPLDHDWTKATCETARTCAACGETEGSPLGHSWTDANCENPKTCNRCGLTEGTPLGHNWQTATCETPKTCVRCGETEGTPLDHDWTEATCETVRTCAACGETEGNPLGHSWTDANCENPKTCDRCGLTEGTALGHTWLEATCDTPQICSVCSKTLLAPLGHEWNAADCEHPSTCIRCGLTDGTPLGHSWTEATCESPKTCTVCAETDGEALGHDWDKATCEEARTCKRCGLEADPALGHTWNEATCDTPKTCSVCGETDGNPLGHDWKAADCVHPSTCARCAATRGAPLGHAWQEATCETPKTCGRCGLTEGTVAAHSWDEGTVTTEPTYDQSGEITYTCTHCGAVRTEEVPCLLPLFTKVEKPDTIAEAHGLSYEVPESGATVLIFFSSSCGNSQFLMRQLNTCSWMANPYLNVIAVETNAGTEEAMQEFRDTYTPDVKDHIRYLYTADDSILFDYYRLFASGNSLTWPLVLIVTDSEQGPMIRYGAEAVTDETALEAALRQVSPAFAGWDGTVHEHTWSEATCEAPKTCDLCGETDGEPLGHDFRDGSCTRCGKDDGTQLVRGDADGDGEVTYLDAMEVLRCAVGLVHLDADVRAACDVDNDNEITYLDAMEILRFAVGLVTEFPPRP